MVSSISISQDNNGVERSFFKDDFSNDTSGQYTLTNTPTWTSGRVELDVNDKFIKPLLSTCTAGKWSMAVAFHTTYATDQAVKLYFGNGNDYMDIQRLAGNAIYGSIYVGGVAVITLFSYATTLADDVYALAECEYTGTQWKLFWNSTQKGSTTTGAAVSVPSIGVRSTDAVTAYIDDITYTPSVAYTDLFAADTSTRYAAVTGTVAYSTDHLNLTAAAGAGNYVRERLRSYQFGRGNRRKKLTLPAACDDGDYVNIKLCATGDLLLGYGVGVKRVAGAWNVITVKDTTVTDSTVVVTGLADGEAFYVEGDWQPDTGEFWGYVYETVKPTAPQVKIFDATYNYGYTGVVGYNAGAGAKIFQLNSVEIRANNIIGRTNVPATESNFYFRDEFTVDSTGRYTPLVYAGSAYACAGGILSLTSTDNTFTRELLPSTIRLNGDFDITVNVIPHVFEANETYGGFVLFNDYNSTGNVYSNAGNFEYVRITFVKSTSVRILVYNQALTLLLTGTTISTEHPVEDDIYKLRVQRVGSTITVTLYNPALASVYSGTYTSTVTNPYVAVSSYPLGATTNKVTYFDNITISGTRYYMKPMLRGAQVGEYWNGSASVPCTRYISSFNWNTIAEYAGDTGSFTWDTTSGWLYCGTTDKQVWLDAAKFSDGVINTKLSWSADTALSRFMIIFRSATQDTGSPYASGNKYYIQIDQRDSLSLRLIKVVAGSSSQIGSAYNFVINATTLYDVTIVFIGSSITLTISGGGISTTISWTDATFTSGYVGFGTYYDGTDKVRVHDYFINALESDTSTGVTYTVGGVPHGARYDTQEEVYLTTTTAQQTLARLRATLISTNYATDSVQWYYENTTDSSSIDTDTVTKTVQIVPDATPYSATRTTLTLNADDIGDTIKCAIRRHAYAVANDNQPAVFCSAFGIVATVTVTDSVVMTDLLKASRLRTTVADSVALTDAKTTRLRHTFTDSVALTDTKTTRLRTTVKDTLPITDRTTTRLRFVVVDSVTITDTAFAHLYKKVVQYNTIGRTIIQYNELSG